MNRCDQEKRLTLFLLGDLPESEAAEFRLHLADCAACQECALELSPVLKTLASGLAKDNDTAPRFDLHRQVELLSVPAERSHRVLDWMARPRSWLLAAASVLIVTGLTYTLLSKRNSTQECSDVAPILLGPVPSPWNWLTNHKTPPAQSRLKLDLNGGKREPSISSASSGYEKMEDMRGIAHEGVVLRLEESGAASASPMPTKNMPDHTAVGGKETYEAEHRADTSSDNLLFFGDNHAIKADGGDKLGREHDAPQEALVIAGHSVAGTVALPAKKQLESNVPVEGLPFAHETIKGTKDEKITALSASGGAGGSGMAYASAGSMERASLASISRSGVAVKEADWDESNKRPAALAKASESAAAGDKVGFGLGARNSKDIGNGELALLDLKTAQTPILGDAEQSSSRAPAAVPKKDASDAMRYMGEVSGRAHARPNNLLVGATKPISRADHVSQLGLPAPVIPASTSMMDNDGVQAAQLNLAPGDLYMAGGDLGRKDRIVQTTNGRLAGPGNRPMSPASTAAPLPLRRPALAFNPFVATTENRFSTFAIDVNTASYNLTRQAIRSGALPDPDVVRTEEILNAFDYVDTAPDRTTFRVYVEGAPSAFGAPGLTMLRIGVKGKRLGREERRPAMLTFLIDTSGSMSEPDRIGRARMALRLLLDQLAPADKLQIVSFDDKARVVLPPTAAARKTEILKAFDQLQCTGSTNLEDGMRRAYQQAAKAFVPGGENRVILISDGVANLGADNAQDILQEVVSFRKQGVTCSVFGVGEGTYNDAMLEDLANKGEGVYRFLDSDEEVKRVFVDDLSATLNNIATDVKIQVEWSSESVRRFRQIGYERRALTTEQFRDDTVEAGEVGSGQAVTALYELDLTPVAKHAPLGTVRVRYRRVDTGAMEEISQAITPEMMAPALSATRPQFRLAVGAAAFAERLRGSPYVVREYADVARLLRPVAQDLSLDPRVKELLSLVEAAEAMSK